MAFLRRPSGQPDPYAGLSGHQRDARSITDQLMAIPEFRAVREAAYSGVPVDPYTGMPVPGAAPDPRAAKPKGNPYPQGDARLRAIAQQHGIELPHDYSFYWGENPDELLKRDSFVRRNPWFMPAIAAGVGGFGAASGIAAAGGGAGGAGGASTPALSSLPVSSTISVPTAGSVPLGMTAPGAAGAAGAGGSTALTNESVMKGITMGGQGGGSGAGPAVTAAKGAMNYLPWVKTGLDFFGGLLGGDEGREQPTKPYFEGTGPTDPRNMLFNVLTHLYPLADAQRERLQKGPQLRQSYGRGDGPGPGPIQIPGLPFQIGGSLGADPALRSPSLGLNIPDISKLMETAGGATHPQLGGNAAPGSNSGGSSVSPFKRVMQRRRAR